MDTMSTGEAFASVGAPEPGQPPGRVRAADHHRRQVQDDLIHDTVADRAPRERRPSLHQHPLDVTLPEHLHQRRERHTRLVAVEDRHVGAGVDPLLTPRRGCELGRRHERRRGRVERPTVAGDASGRIHDHPQRRPRRRVRGVADREARIVGEGGAGAHDDRVGPRAQTLDVRPRLLSGDPCRRAIAGGRLPVERGRHLQHDEGAAGTDVGAEGEVLAGSHRSASRPSSTASPASRSVRNPLPSTMGFGSPVAAITASTPAAIRARAQGGVRPW